MKNLETGFGEDGSGGCDGDSIDVMLEVVDWLISGSLVQRDIVANKSSNCKHLRD
ncbi:hypothetical protein [Poriferisphaera corsica]|uniref:hypothetical protein n=1 Tax=Poriferisphaera corsica TaxID=2528020 RepID=UPI001909AB57|nr:hypothetical protein [Poriferisphaera corsica]